MNMDNTNTASGMVRRPDWLNDLGPIPEPTIVRENPAYEEWIERVALRLCIDADEPGKIPTPCSSHLTQARTIGHFARVTVNG